MTVTAHRDRWTQILQLLTEGDLETPLVERVCAVSAVLLDVSGAGMCLIGGRRHRIIVHGTDPLAEELELLQLSLGQGPCIEAVRTGLPVVVADLWTEHPDRWAAYAEAALGRGVRAVFTFPLQIAAVDLGALDLYRLQPGLLTREQTDDVLILADIATRSMLAQPNKIHVDGSVSAENWQERSRSAPAGPGRAVDLGITVGQALAPLRPDAITDALDPR
jgi:GAF domain-containing protein